MTLEIANAKRADKKFGVLFCDLDDFKPMNDIYGHEFGDEVLKTVADTLRISVRETDLPARFGGDEFAVLVTNIKTQNDIGVIKSKLDAACGAIEFIGRNAKVRLSIGTALFPDDAKDIDTLMEHADHDMYEAKQAIKRTRPEP